ncbi:MAG: hypothetical protein M1816_004859 [Peltula sp. TS41687]|nr:MAG: hypothetical protein M1816_004859 [Peltula sp. TS41687]
MSRRPNYLSQSLRQIYHSTRQHPKTHSHVPCRRISTIPALRAEVLETTSPGPILESAMISTNPSQDQSEAAAQTKTPPPIGSRRRRAALKSSANIPFEQLPYQCFQEARKILQADREEKLKQMEMQRGRIAKLQLQKTKSRAEELQKLNRLTSMEKRLRETKILADINDPMIKKRFEDGLGDMNRPIYRHLADKRWRSYQRSIMMQRLTTMAVVPDVLSHLDITAEVRLAFRDRKVHPGAMVDSRVSEVPPRLRVQVFDKGARMVSVMVMDPDVPDLERDSFRQRCHYLAANIPISPTETSVPLSRLHKDSQVLLPWLPPHSQKGSPYHRLVVLVMQQLEGKLLDVASLKETVRREDFNHRSYQQRNTLKPIGAFLFRTVWDEGTAAVMARAGLPGADVEFKRKRVEPLVKPQLPLRKFKNRLGLAGLPSKRL